MKKTTARRGRAILIGLAVYVLIILFFSTDTYFANKFKGVNLLFREQLVFYAERWLPWAILTPLIFFLAGRIRFSRSRWPSALAFHGIGCLVFTLLQNLAFFGVRYFTISISRERTFVSGFVRTYFGFYQYNILTYAVIVGVAIAAEYYRRSRENELKTAQLETRLAGAELQALRMQVHPHFLFNTLHAVSALVHRNPDVADRMINRLSDMFRLSLESSSSQEISVENELEALKPYLEIMDMRFGDRLRVVVDFPEETRDALVPNLILQPLLENAIRHGIVPKPEGGTVTLRGRRNGDRFLIEIADDGPGFPGESSDLLRNGLGLSNTKERLALLYGKNYEFRLSRGGKGGALVVLNIPFRTAGGMAPDSKS
jgi:two-component system LytT family sensor kinase